MTKKEMMVQLMELQGTLTKMGAPEDILKAMDKVTEKCKVDVIAKAIEDGEKLKAHLEQEAKKAAQKPAASAKPGKGGKSTLKANGKAADKSQQTKADSKPEKTADKPETKKPEEKKSPFIPVTVEDESGAKMELVPGATGFTVTNIINGEVWIAQFTPQELLKQKNATGGNILYSAKNPELSRQLRECKKEEYPIANGIDLFKAIASNEEVILFQSEYTGVFTSYNKRDMCDRIKAGKLAIYSEKKEEKKSSKKDSEAGKPE